MITWKEVTRIFEKEPRDREIFEKYDDSVQEQVEIKSDEWTDMRTERKNRYREIYWGLFSSEKEWMRADEILSAGIVKQKDGSLYSVDGYKGRLSTRYLRSMVDKGILLEKSGGWGVDGGGIYYKANPDILRALIRRHAVCKREEDAIYNLILENLSAVCNGELDKFIVENSLSVHTFLDYFYTLLRYTYKILLFGGDSCYSLEYLIMERGFEFMHYPTLHIDVFQSEEDIIKKDITEIEFEFNMQMNESIKSCIASHVYSHIKNYYIDWESISKDIPHERTNESIKDVIGYISSVENHIIKHMCGDRWKSIVMCDSMNGIVRTEMANMLKKELSSYECRTTENKINWMKKKIEEFNGEEKEFEKIAYGWDCFFDEKEIFDNERLEKVKEYYERISQLKEVFRKKVKKINPELHKRKIGFTSPN